jgi:transposase-like protein
LTEVGPVPLDTPRDRQGSFEPRLVPKGARRAGGLDEMIVSLYAEFELRRREHFATKTVARARVAAWIDEYNRDRKHSACGMRSPIGYEQALRAGRRPGQTPAA